MSGEAVQAVYGLMASAASQDPAVIKEAHSQLTKWETQPMFFSAVHAVFCNRQLDLSVRQVAVIYFKNGIDRYWRKRAPDGISEEEKAVLRGQLLAATLDEDVPQLFRQLQVLVAKAARHDWPTDWPALMGDLIQAFSTSADPARRLRALITLHAVIKEVASKVIAKRNFRQVAPELCEGVRQLWTGYVQGPNSHGDEAHVCVKIMRRLLCFGFADLTTVPNVHELLAAVLDRLRASVAEWVQCGDPGQQARIELSIKHLAKLVAEVQSHHPATFVRYLLPTLSLCLETALHGRGAGPKVFYIRCLRFIHDVLNEFEYGPGAVGDAPEQAQAAIRSVLTDAALVDLTKALITVYFVMTLEDLREWEDNPEEYAHDVTDLTLFEVKPCAESLFQTLMTHHRTLLAPVVMELLHATTDAPCDPSDLGQVLARDCVYNAVGLAAHDLYECINFQAWLATGLAAELTVVHPNYKIVRRQVAVLIEKWADVCKFPAEQHAHVYTMLMSLHAHTEDMVVRLAANSALRAVLDCVDFRVYAFRDFMGPALHAMFSLMNDTSEDDSKLRVLNTLATMLQRCRQDMKPYGGEIAGQLPVWWSEAEERHMLQCTIIATLKYFVEAMGTDGGQWHEGLLNIVAYCTNLAMPAHVYLLEEGVALWLAIVEAATQGTPALLGLFPRALELLERGSEGVREVVRITDMYIALAPQLVQECGAVLCRAFIERLDQWKAEGLELLARTSDIAIVAQGAAAVQILTPLLVEMLKRVAQRKEDDSVLLCYTALFARVCVQQNAVFRPLMHECNVAMGGSGAMGVVVGCWLDKLDAATDDTHKKLIGLALAILLGQGDATALQSFGLVVNACVQILSSLTFDSASDDYLCMPDDEEAWAAEPGETPATTRERELKRHDAVFRLSLRQVLKDNFAQLQATNPTLPALVASVDPHVMQQLAALIG